VALDRQLLLRQRQRFPGSNPQLPFDQIQPGDHLGHRMLDLQPGVHFHEVEVAVFVGDEFHRAGIHIADRPRRRNRGVAHFAAALSRHSRCRRLLEDLLMTALHRAVALEQIHAMPLRVRKHLHLDVPRTGEILLDQHPVIAERGGRFALRRSERIGKIPRLPDHPHALAAASRGRLDQHRVADAIGFLLERRGVLRGAVIAGHQRHAGLFHQRLCGALRSHRLDRASRRTDEHHPGLPASLRKLRVLGQEAVTGMDRLRAAFPPGLEDAVRAQIRFARMRRSDQVGLVAACHVQRVCVRLRINGDSAYAEPFRGARDTAGDLASVGYENFLKHLDQELSHREFFTIPP
jgi:hypothetical protein